MWHWFSLMSTVLSSHICLSFTCGNWQTPNLLESPLDAGTSDTSASLHQPVLADCLTGAWQSTVACSTTPTRTHTFTRGVFCFFHPKGAKKHSSDTEKHRKVYILMSRFHAFNWFWWKLSVVFFSPLIPFPLFFAFQELSLGSLKLHWFWFTGFIPFFLTLSTGVLDVVYSADLKRQEGWLYIHTWWWWGWWWLGHGVTDLHGTTVFPSVLPLKASLKTGYSSYIPCGHPSGK